MATSFDRLLTDRHCRPQRKRMRGLCLPRLRDQSKMQTSRLGASLAFINSVLPACYVLLVPNMFVLLQRFAVTAFVLAAIAGRLPAAESKISYTRQIKPILASKCFVCHGPDEKE